MNGSFISERATMMHNIKIPLKMLQRAELHVGDKYIGNVEFYITESDAPENSFFGLIFINDPNLIDVRDYTQRPALLVLSNSDRLAIRLSAHHRLYRTYTMPLICTFTIESYIDARNIQ